MTDLASVVQQAVYDALVAGVTLAPVMQHVPLNTPPPVVFLGNGDVSQEGSKGDRLERHDVAIMTVAREPGRRPLLALQEQVRAALDDQALGAQPGAILSRPQLTSTTDQLLEDGATYAGAQRFTIFAQPAD